MNIYFGLELDDITYPKSNSSEGGIHHFGPQGLLTMLESHLGLIGHPANNEHIRIEQFRQALQIHLEENNDCFYKTSFEADQLATSATLLSLRDELLLEDWNFKENNNTPTRLKTINEVEAIFSNKKNNDDEILSLSFGFADRFIAVKKSLDTRNQPITNIFLNEPLEFLPKHFQKLLAKLQSKGAQIRQIETPATAEDSDLSIFQKIIKKELPNKEKYTLKNDGSLLLIKAKRETDAAIWLAKNFNQNKNFKPLCLIPEKNRAIDNALIQEGLPSLGILSASLARPSLQILKLVSTFLWQPIDPYKILEFVSLTVKPLRDDLAKRIARQIAQTPGINSSGWKKMIGIYFSKLEDQAQNDTSIDVASVRKQFDFWFNRRRYDVSRTVPKKDAIEIFEYLQNWAIEEFQDSNEKNTSMIVLSDQARRVKDLLEALPQTTTQLSHLELERIVRTIYEPSPVLFKEKEIGHLSFVHQSSSIIGQTDQLLWWNFVRNEPDHFFSRWYKHELDFLVQNDIHLQSPEDKNRLLIWHRSRPILRTNKQLVLIMPKMVNGSEVFPHPLHDVMEATFENLKNIIFNIDTEHGKALLEKHFQLPQKELLEQRPSEKQQPFIFIKNPKDLDQREHETFTSLDSLLFFPYQWFFKHKIKLHRSSILSIVKDPALMGNLSHRFFELMFQEDVKGWNKRKVEQWIDENASNLLSREGAVLLMYGREPERVNFINKLKYASWSLLSMIQKNGWEVDATEMDLEGNFDETKMKAKADLVLKRKDEKMVVDLKWRGSARRKNIIKNEEDLQLVMYSKLLDEDHSWAHTGYYILSEGKLIARNALAINEVVAVVPQSDHIEINQRVFDKMVATYKWRVAQLQKGQIEVRTQATSPDLEDAYAGQIMDLLEMKDGDAPFDDYRTLVDKVE